MNNIINKKLTVQIRKVTVSNDGLIRVSVSHPYAKYVPTFVFDKEFFEKFEELVLKNYENKEER